MNFATRRKQTELTERRDLRHQREDAAGKLHERAPDLASLDLRIHEARPNGCVNDTQYIRRIVVEHAPALFEVPCSFAECRDGGYDVTREVLSAVAARKTQFEGDQACRGTCGPVDCGRVLHYKATATYRVAPSTTAGGGG